MSGGLVQGSSLPDMLTRIPAQNWLWVSLGVITVVTLASLYKYAFIRGGGRTIAESLGGRLVQSNSIDLRERRLLNVVEEMAIAAGISVPPVYLIQRTRHQRLRRRLHTRMTPSSALPTAHSSTSIARSCRA